MLKSQDSRQGSLAQTNTKVLVLSTVLLYLSTGTYIAALIWNRSQANRLVLGATDGLYSASYDGQQGIAAFEDALRGQSWMAVIALESRVGPTITNTTSIHALIAVIATVHYRGRDRMVACMRHLAQQSGVLHRAASCDSYIRYVSFGLHQCHSRPTTSQYLAS